MIAVTVIRLAFAGYSLSNSHSTTVTQQQLLTNTQSSYNTQTTTSLTTPTSVATTTRTNTGSNYGHYHYQYCGYYGCYYPGPPGYKFNPPCQPMGSNTYQCFGWLYQDANGCVDLIVAVTDRFGYQLYEYYALHNLPSFHPAFGSWVTVAGQTYRGYNTGAYRAACPNNYIEVTSITE